MRSRHVGLPIAVAATGLLTKPSDSRGIGLMQPLRLIQFLETTACGFLM
jgi:hypothetical protein